MKRIIPLFVPFLAVGCFPEVEVKSDALGTIGDGPDGLDDGPDGEADRDADGDGFPASEDCDDTDPAVSPNADEICDGIDNDCDGEIDPDTAVDATDWFTDADADGYGTADDGGRACTPPDGSAPVAGDCDDGNRTIHPDAEEVCDNIDNDCDGRIDAEDDSIDQALLTTFYADTDGDGFGDEDRSLDACALPSGYVDRAEDCDDDNGAVNPDSVEVCDDIDNDCDSRIDDDDDDVDPSTFRDFYADGDRDGYGTGEVAESACSTPDGYADTNDDCNDDNADVNPGAVEVCDERDVDEDCSGAADDDDPDVDVTTATTWYADGDDDGYGSDSDSGSPYCDDPSSTASAFVTDNTDCDDSRSSVNSGEDEVCDDADLDENCNGLADDADATVDPGSFFSWYIDSDSDNYGDEAATPVGACGDPSTSTDRYALNALDCNDAESAINPAATEICDAADTDEDCDGLADDADPSVDTATGSPWYPDEDDDGYGTDDSTGDLFCDDPGTGYDATADDCDDNDASVNPGATEVCNDTDDDCDPTTGQAGMAQFVDSSNAATDLQATFAAGTPSSLASWTSSTDGTLWMCEGTWYAQLEIATNHTVDILGPDGAAVTILDGNYQDSIVYLNEGSDVYMSGLTIQYGYAYGGGGLVVDQGSFTGEDLIFEENYATYGGAFLTSDAAVSFEDSTFSANAAYYGGAGLVADDGSHKVSFSDCTFDGNDSYDNGGGLHFFDSPEVMVTDTTFVDNFAVNDGGGIYVDEGTLFVDSCEFDGNLSDHDGGGIYAADDISIVDTLFIDNEAGDDGGGVYLTLGRFETATISGSSSSSSGASSTVFSGNMADDNGEAVYIRIADDWFNGGELQVDDVDFGSDDLYHRTASWASFSPGSAASFTCTHWYNCY